MKKKTTPKKNDKILVVNGFDGGLRLFEGYNKYCQAMLYINNSVAHMPDPRLVALISAYVVTKQLVIGDARSTAEARKNGVFISR